jgi:acyl carrier protein
MSEQEIMHKLTDVFRDLFDQPDLVLTAATSADDVDEWDSVNHVMLVVQVEREFGVKFHTAEIEELKNVGDLASLIQSKLVAAAA